MICLKKAKTHRIHLLSNFRPNNKTLQISSRVKLVKYARNSRKSKSTIRVSIFSARPRQPASQKSSERVRELVRSTGPRCTATYRRSRFFCRRISAKRRRLPSRQAREPSTPLLTSRWCSNLWRNECDCCPSTKSSRSDICTTTDCRQLRFFGGSSASSACPATGTRSARCARYPKPAVPAADRKSPDLYRRSDYATGLTPSDSIIPWSRRHRSSGSYCSPDPTVAIY